MGNREYVSYCARHEATHAIVAHCKENNKMNYYENMDKIETLWKKTRDSSFNRKNSDALYAACQEGRILFWQEEIPECKEKGWSLPTEVPAYKRAIMLLEKEQKYKTAIELAQNALKVGIKNVWYTNKIDKFNKMMGQK